MDLTARQAILQFPYKGPTGAQPQPVDCPAGGMA
jgi:hypothetical protein